MRGTEVRALLCVAAAGLGFVLLGTPPSASAPLGPQGPPGSGVERRVLTRTALESGGGRRNSVAIGADGRGLISYDGWRRLQVAHCTDLACTSATVSTLDTCDLCEPHTSIAIGADGLGLISYTGSSVEHPRVVHCSDVACSSATISTLGEPDHFAFGISSIAIGADGLGLIGFIEPKGLIPKVAHCSNVKCSTATISPLDKSVAFRDGMGVAIGADGLGLFSYAAFGTLKVAHCSNLDCSSVTSTVIDDDDNDNGVGDWSSIAIGTDGLGLVSYLDRANGALKAAHCSNVKCSAATTATIDSSGDIGGFTSLAIGADGLGVISYEAPQTRLGPLKVAHCSNVACSSATSHTLDAAGNLFGTSVAVGVDGFPLVSWYENGSGLQVVHCSNFFCIP